MPIHSKHTKVALRKISVSSPRSTPVIIAIIESAIIKICIFLIISVPFLYISLNFRTRFFIERWVKQISQFHYSKAPAAPQVKAVNIQGNRIKACKALIILHLPINTIFNKHSICSDYNFFCDWPWLTS